MVKRLIPLAALLFGGTAFAKVGIGTKKAAGF